MGSFLKHKEYVWRYWKHRWWTTGGFPKFSVASNAAICPVQSFFPRHVHLRRGRPLHPCLHYEHCCVSTLGSLTISCSSHPRYRPSSATFVSTTFLSTD